MDKRKALEAAMAYVQQGKLDRAIAEYEAILKADPSDCNVLNALGDLCARTGNKAEAIAHFMRLGEFYRGDGLNVRGIAVYKKVLKLDRTHTEASLACADMYAEQGLVAEARLQLQGIADQYLKGGDLPKALEIYEKMIQLDPGHRPTVSKIAEILVKTRRVELAIAELNGLGERLIGSGQADDAREIYERAVELLTSQGRKAEAARFAEGLNSLRLAEVEATVGDAGTAFSPGEGDHQEPAGVVAEEAPVEQEESATLDMSKEIVERISAEPEGVMSPQEGSLLLEGITGEAEERVAPGEMVGADVSMSEGVQLGEETEPASIVSDPLEGSDDLATVVEQASESVAFVGSPTLEEELQEGEFFVQQGMVEEARAIFQRILLREPEHPLAKRRMAVIEQIEGAGEEGVALVDEHHGDLATPISPRSDRGGSSVFKVATPSPPEGEYVDLAGEISEELEVEEDPLVQSMLQKLERGIQEQIDVTDYETHYNLGIAYKDMELYDKALEEFRLAANDGAYRVRCASLLGLCYLAKGQPERAVEELQNGLSATEAGTEERWGVLYDLATAYEALRDAQKALEALLAIQGEVPKFRDVRVRVRDLRERLEAGRGSAG